MINKLNAIFSSKNGLYALSQIEKAITEFDMQPLLDGGAVVGLSGGADSVMLLLALSRLKLEGRVGRIVAVHINHMIRGEEADRDEEFCRSLAARLDVPFRSYRIDIPHIAELRKKGIEETARDERYRVFFETAREEGLRSVAIAHNATDNLETILINMMRGAGIDGAAGIPPVRDNVIRPLINLTKAEITSLLSSSDIPYVTDSTNESTEYTRNYVRLEILPRLRHLSPEPEKMASRLSRNLRSDASILEEITSEYVSLHYRNGRISQEELKKLKKPFLFRVLREILKQNFNCSIEYTHLDAIWSGLEKSEFSYSLPGMLRFTIKDGYAFLEDDRREAQSTESIPETALKEGINTVDGFSSVIILSDTPSFESYSNVYKISISAAIPSDIINDGLMLRGKRDGDCYTYGGSTRKLKKLFNDRNIPTDMRGLVPVILDKNGIVWVAGFGVRGEGELERQTYIAIAEPLSVNSALKKLYITERK